MAKIDPEIEAMITSDPFADVGGEEPSPEPSEQRQEQPLAEPASSAPEGGDSGEQPGVSASEGQADLLELTRALIASQNSDSSQAPAKTEQKDKPSAPEMPKYEFDIRDELVNGLNSADPQTQKAALSALVQGIAQAIHSQMDRSLGGRFDSLPSTVDERVQAHLQQQQVIQDFYTTHSDLNLPELRPIVGFAAKAMQEELRQQGKEAVWTPEFRDKLAERVRKLSGTSAKGASAQPPHVFQSGSRPDNGSKMSAQERAAAEIAAIVGD